MTASHTRPGVVAVVASLLLLMKEGELIATELLDDDFDDRP